MPKVSERGRFLAPSSCTCDLNRVVDRRLFGSEQERYMPVETLRLHHSERHAPSAKRRNCSGVYQVDPFRTRLATSAVKERWRRWIIWSQLKCWLTQLQLSFLKLYEIKEKMKMSVINLKWIFTTLDVLHHRGFLSWGRGYILLHSSWRAPSATAKGCLVFRFLELVKRPHVPGTHRPTQQPALLPHFCIQAAIWFFKSN